LASDTIRQRYGAMRFGITASQIKENVYAYPTFSSDIRYMLGHA
jgi:glutathione reductase (NADPH)